MMVELLQPLALVLVAIFAASGFWAFVTRSNRVRLGLVLGQGVVVVMLPIIGFVWEFAGAGTATAVYDEAVGIPFALDIANVLGLGLLGHYLLLANMRFGGWHFRMVSVAVLSALAIVSLCYGWWRPDDLQLLRPTVIEMGEESFSWTFLVFPLVMSDFGLSLVAIVGMLEKRIRPAKILLASLPMIAVLLCFLYLATGYHIRSGARVWVSQGLLVYTSFPIVAIAATGGLLAMFLLLVIFLRCGYFHHGAA